MDLNINRRGFLTRTSHAMAGVAAWSSIPLAARAADTAGERRFELGTVTYNIAKDWDLETLIQKCEQLGLMAVELRTTHKHGVEPTLSAADRAKVRARFKETPVVLFGLGTACEFHSPDAAVVKQNIELTEQFVKLAHDVGAIGVKVRPNGLAEKQGIAVDATLKQIGHALQECGSAADRFGIEIWVEVHGNGTSHPPHMRKIMEYCGHPAVGVTWNSNMPTDVKDGSVREYFTLLKDYIRCVHINEMWNGYPYRELFTLLRGIGYDRYTMAEIPDSTDRERLLRYYRKLWDELSSPK